MPLSDADRQRRRRERLKQSGLTHARGWATPEQAAAATAILRGEPAAWPAKDWAPVSKPKPVISQSAIRQLRAKAASRAPQGLAAVIEHMGWGRCAPGSHADYATLRDLLSPTGYRLACAAEARLLLGQGLDAVEVAVELVRRGVPLPDGKGRWTGAKIRSLVDESE